MEENRKKKAIEEEIQKKEQQKLQKVQALIDSLKSTREFLYKLGNKAVKGTLEHYLQNGGGGLHGKHKKLRQSEKVKEEEEEDKQESTTNTWH